MQSRERTRVCHLVQGLARGGVESLLLDVVRATSDAVDHSVAYLNEHDAMAEPLRGAGADVARIDVPWTSPRTAFDPRSVGETASHLRRVAPDVVHAHYPLYLHVLGRAAGALAGVDRVIGTYHNPDTDFHAAVRYLERATRPLSTANVGVSGAVTRSFVDGVTGSLPGFGVDGTVYNGVDVEEFDDAVAAADEEAVVRRWNVDPGDVVFLSVGRYAAQKSQGTLVRAADRLTGAGVDAHLLLVGHGPLEDDLRELVRERGLDDVVTVTGEVPSIHEYYALGDVFVSSSDFEGFPIVLLEAMAAGLPVVATDVSGSAEVVADGETGALVPSADPETFAAEMAEFADAERREHAGRRGRQRVRERFDVEEAAESYLDLYRR